MIFRLLGKHALRLRGAIVGLVLIAWAHGAESAPMVLPEVRVNATVQTDSSLGTSTYTLGRGQIETIAQGPDSTFNQILFRTPGVSRDSAGEIHVRLEDPYTQYYINGTLLPRAINGFAQEINAHFVESLSLKVGALPAQYAWGNYGIVTLESKTGASLAGSELSIYGGSYDTLHATASTGGSTGKTDYFFTAGAISNSLGIENPTDSARAIHDRTRQYQGLGYVARKLSDRSSVSLLVSASHGDFEIPNNPGQASEIEFLRRGEAWRAANYPNPDSSQLDERQSEQSYYGVLSYRQALPDLTFQVSQVSRYSQVLFKPDVVGDLYFQGVAARVFRDIFTVGLQADFTYRAGAENTIRGGLLIDVARARGHNQVSVFAAEDDDVDPVTGKWIAKNAPFMIADHHAQRGYDQNFYLQDEWKATPRLTLNVGARFDNVQADVTESQVSPRVSAVYQLAKDTTVHAGYARYFIPPPMENVSPNSVDKFFGKTTNSPDIPDDDPVRCERSNYFDVGFTHSFSPEWDLGVDAYYKRARNQIDDGQFGAANIFSPFNFETATFYGVEVALAYQRGPLSAYANFAASDGYARNIISSQFEFEQDEFDYIKDHNVTLDQTQYYTASAGAAHAWKHTTLHGDVVYGNGMHTGENNRDKLPAYYPVNVGVEHRIPVGRKSIATLRLDVINVFDQRYVLSDGKGIGMGSPRYGMRRGLFGGVKLTF